MTIIAAPDHTASPSRQRVVLVTGTSSGIGLAAAVAAAVAGWTTVATLRNPARAEALKQAAAAVGVTLDIRALDVTDPASIAACLNGVLADHGRLDALVNNAGAAHVGTAENDDMAEIRACLEVNFFGVVAMTKAALPHLRVSGGRVLTVSSVGGVVGQPFNEAYCAAKFAVEGYMESLAPVAATVGVTIGVVEPGAVASEFVTNLGMDPAAMIDEAGPYGPALQNYLARVSGQFATSAQPATEVADVIVGLLAADELPFRSQTSTSATGFAGIKLGDLDGSAVQELTRAWVAG